jgi:2-(1,2-epoxy-1,2-dihydrophenyl)acetyl-CoA isomerase
MDGAQAPAKVTTATEGGVRIITLNDPSTLNAAGVELMGDLRGAVGKAIADPAVRAIVITGEGRGFCSGANLSGRGDSSGGDGAVAASDGPNQALLQVYNPFVSMIRRSPKPLVAAVNGVAAGVGVASRWPATSWWRPRAATSCSPSAASAWCRTAARPGSCPVSWARRGPWS